MSRMSPVASFESSSAGLVPLGRHDTMASASAQLPEGAYTTFRTYGGNGVVRLDQHLRRLEQSVALKGTPGLIEAAAARAALGEALRAARHAESRVRLTFAPPRLFVALEAFTPLDPALYERGAAAVTLDMQRDNPQAKDTRFIATAREAYSRLPPGVEEGLLVAEDGTLLEGLSSNFFAVAAGILHTEEERALAGITRTLVLEAARGVLPLATTALRLDQLREATEAFLTSASRGILPVVRVDDVRIGTGRPGPITAELRRRFDEIIARETEPL
jgi:branched-chain amino acid aminotransferase